MHFHSFDFIAYPESQNSNDKESNAYRICEIYGWQLFLWVAVFIPLVTQGSLYEHKLFSLENVMVTDLLNGFYFII